MPVSGEFECTFQKTRGIQCRQLDLTGCRKSLDEALFKQSDSSCTSYRGFALNADQVLDLPLMPPRQIC